MASRIDLQVLLETVLGSRNVYFTPPNTLKLGYPCIIYSLDRINVDHADDMNYIVKKRYQIILVDKNPDSPLVDALMEIPKMEFDRQYIADGLYHFTFSLYF